ncbi:MAG: hypothetical protein A3B74_03805 [Candidatus Kerfeldbacteria bacterium RIFCSPHIGHO2_02_FULL_42_14]|uniref:ABC transporter permease n=1 Tax=Candidatus Kerfeldbacteria bacterium RIFCSPHIGHO2_02_FULL_42_14 TaxID=1798540 RepID=A0A1G2AQ02_9BACT|nr:MAG: hypothetical protein A3B74_03805 [Candidatus Kerfeldbacteria bacterium RIFCSPHIGHO2_02_FULL_42_14]OGY80638.1 MAG: hypothetical protein A3E60_04305 [Candidatus Kerfeldbacteria bacterium RIFCSPHIGHO2_12_FULL_42_13]OGY82562.1 MAG: hypothetical protein A3I91_03965 [Candidatus Kerfeldbacteria bacterium RIFCSPLOWO2_02_FULL_42_19]OGY85166.1 MAG: hypothetical protein A3G01_01095 [Candidatus Kerfeldbacteria bacterium RIFCSPLOWO2_12_FULL_43_9]
MFSKYIHTAKLSIQNQIVYRFNITVFALKEVIVAFALIIFWHAVYQDGFTLGNFSFHSLVVYYLTVALMQLASSEGIAWNLIEDIQEGNILNFILKPLQSIWFFLARTIGGKIGQSFFLWPLLGFIFIGFWYFHLVTMLSIVAFFLFFILALLLSYFTYFLIAIIAFYTESSWAFILFWHFISSFLGGAFLPLDAFPLWLQHLSAFLPFQYLFYVPARFLAGDFENFWFALLIVFAWISIFALLSKFLWHIGIKSYEAYGR